MRNEISDSFGTIGGGLANKVTEPNATIGGGAFNTCGTRGGTIAGGESNRASATFAAIGGGSNNFASGSYAAIAGGMGNRGGSVAAAIAGGMSNQASAIYSAIGGGYANTGSGDASVIAGGWKNNAGGDCSAIGGGSNHLASGKYSTIPGGRENTATGECSFAAGRRANAVHPGAFVWADSTDADFNSTTNNEFAIRADGGLRISSEAGDDRRVPFGTRYGDNTVVAWAKIQDDGSVVYDFNIHDVIHTNTGSYHVYLASPASAASAVVPIASPEIDGQPTSAAAARMTAVDQINVTSFYVYVFNGNFTAVNNEFTIIVTGR